MTCWFCGRSDPPKDEPLSAIARGSTIYVAALSLRDAGDWRGMSAAWSCDTSPQYALGYAMNRLPAEVQIVSHLAFEIPLASGIETEGQDAQRLGAEHESPTAESGDAQPSGSGAILPKKERLSK